MVEMSYFPTEEPVGEKEEENVCLLFWVWWKQLVSVQVWGW